MADRVNQEGIFKEKLIMYFLYFENEKPIPSHHYDHYCNEFGPFFLLKGEPLGKGFDDTLTVGPYRSKLRAFSAYRRASGGATKERLNARIN